jgi:hypothetical protein
VAQLRDRGQEPAAVPLVHIEVVAVVDSHPVSLVRGPEDPRIGG